MTMLASQTMTEFCEQVNPRVLTVLRDEKSRRMGPGDDMLRVQESFNYLLATAVAVEAAVVHNFALREQFTWSDRVRVSWRNSPPRFLRFNATTGAVSIIGNMALMKVLVGQGHMNYLIANAIAISLCSIANFLVSEEWVFQE